MEHKYSINLKPVSFLKALLMKKDRDALRNDFLKWVDDFKRVFSDFTIEMEGKTIIIRADWTEVLEDLIWSYEYNIPMNEIEEKYDFFMDITPSAMDNSSNSTTKASFNHRREVKSVSIHGELVHNGDSYDVFDFLTVAYFHIWRCCNLSFPGSFHFYQVEIVVDGDNGGKLMLPSDSIGNIYNSKFNDCLRIGIVDIDKTWEWYKSVIDMNSLITTNSFDRAISSFFNYVRHGSFMQSDIVNLFMAIESFYNLSSREIKDTLKKRSIDFLEVHEFKKKFSRGVSDFYDYRSRFVHGDIDILSYLDLLQNFVRDVPAYDEYSDNCEFGVLLLLASFQKAIELRCEELRYKETKIIVELP